LHLLEEEQHHPIVRFAYLCHMVDEEFVFLSSSYIKLFELGVEIAFKQPIRGYPPQSSSAQISTLEQLL